MVQRLLGLRLLMLAVRKNFFLRAPKEPSSTRCNLPVWSSISKRRMGADPDRAPLVRCLSLGQIRLQPDQERERDGLC